MLLGTRNGDLIFITALAVFTFGTVLIDLPPVVRIVPAVPLVLFAPGYAVQAIVFRRDSLASVDRLIIALGMSMVIAIVAGLLLAAVGIPLAPLTWTGLLSLLTIGATGVAWLRRQQLRDDAPTSHGAWRMRWRDALRLALAGVSVLLIMLGTRQITASFEQPIPAQLWLLPDDDGSLGARLGVRSGGVGGTFFIRLTAAGVLLEEFSVRLAQGETWQTDVQFTASERRQPIVGRLYDDPSSAEIRFVVLQPPPDAS
jgi:hypothetical protein